MEFVKQFLNEFLRNNTGLKDFLDEILIDKSVVGLSGLKKNTEYVFIKIPKEIKKTYVTNTKNNYILF